MRTSLVEDEVEPAGAAAFEAIRRGGGMSTAVDDASYYPGNNPVPEQEKAAVEAPARNGKPAEPTGHVGQFAEIGNAAAISSPTTGPMERAALELVQAGKALDDALRASVEAKQKVAVAARAWREAISELPSATNGHAPDVETTT